MGAARGGACTGRYSPRAVLSRTRFALCPRGDVPTTPRPFDAARYGAIPVLISDHINRVGLPFQCWVPWRLLSLVLPERDAKGGFAEALRNLSARVTGPAAALARTGAEGGGGGGEDGTERAGDGNAHRASTVEERMRRVLLHFRRDLLWSAKESRVAENVLLDAVRWRTRLLTDDADGGCCPFGDEVRLWDRRR